jgi:hypothetical protein
MWLMHRRWLFQNAKRTVGNIKNTEPLDCGSKCLAISPENLWGVSVAMFTKDRKTTGIKSPATRTGRLTVYPAKN